MVFLKFNVFTLINIFLRINLALKVMMDGNFSKKKIYAIKVDTYIVLTYRITPIGLKIAIEDHKSILARYRIEKQLLNGKNYE